MKYTQNSSLNDYYKNKFVENKNIRTEYGNSDLSFDFFINQNVPKNSKILEVGCNTGTLTNRLFNEGYKNIIAIDVNSESIKYGREKYPDIASLISSYDGEKLDFSDESFDFVISFDVIEHIPDVHKHFLEVNRVLRKDGKYIFQTPNKYINTIWMLVNNKTFHNLYLEHCSLQSYFTLKRLIRKTGFTLIYIGKHRLLNDYNKTKVEKKFGKFGLILLSIFQKLPIIIYPNFWVVVSKGN
ncbi:MAG: class I SAM-dependent methyltransferase [bacterium]